MSELALVSLGDEEREGGRGDAAIRMGAFRFTPVGDAKGAGRNERAKRWSRAVRTT